MKVNDLFVYSIIHYYHPINSPIYFVVMRKIGNSGYYLFNKTDPSTPSKFGNRIFTLFNENNMIVFTMDPGSRRSEANTILSACVKGQIFDNL
jgi:hypothetical protein